VERFYPRWCCKREYLMASIMELKELTMVLKKLNAGLKELNIYLTVFNNGMK
jgi:hypothetical protein